MNHRQLTPRQLAHVDQVLAQSRPIVDELVRIAAADVEENGRDLATAILATTYERHDDIGRLATVAAIAIVRLAEQQLAEEQQAIAEDVKFERTQDAASGEARP